MEFETPLCENNTIVNVTNFGVSMTNDRIFKMFEKYGNISSYGIMNVSDGWHRFAYVAFEDSDAAEEAVIELNGQKIDDDRRIRVRRTRKRQAKHNRPTAWSRIRTIEKQNITESAAVSSNSSSSCVENPPKDHHREKNDFSVYVKNLDPIIDRVVLKKLFQSYGTILEARVIMDREGCVPKSRGYGFVTFAREEDAMKAISEKSGCIINGRIVRVEMARGKNRDLGSGGLQRNFENLGLNERGKSRILRPHDQTRSCSLPSLFEIRENERCNSESETRKIIATSFLGNQHVVTLRRSEENVILEELSSSDEEW